MSHMRCVSPGVTLYALVENCACFQYYKGLGFIRGLKLSTSRSRHTALLSSAKPQQPTAQPWLFGRTTHLKCIKGCNSMLGAGEVAKHGDVSDGLAKITVSAPVQLGL
jgi:hypothetical protein